MGSSDMILNWGLVTQGWSPGVSQDLNKLLLTEITVNVQPSQECNNIYTSLVNSAILGRWLPNLLISSQFCAGGLTGNTAPGDSGGPAILRSWDNGYQYTIIGVVSGRFKFGDGIYTLVPDTNILKWIRNSLSGEVETFSTSQRPSTQEKVIKPTSPESASQSSLKGEAILITGGWISPELKRYTKTAELWSPSGFQCFLPELNTAREFHTQSGLTACGGGYLGGTARTNCETLLSNGQWSNSYTLKSERYGHSMWKSKDGIILIGGYDKTKTTELIKSSESEESGTFKETISRSGQQQMDFTLLYETM